MSGADYDCPNCDGRLAETANPDVYECQRCDTQIRKSVCEQMDAFKRVAKRGGPLADAARAALEGDR